MDRTDRPRPHDDDPDPTPPAAPAALAHNEADCPDCQAAATRADDIVCCPIAEREAAAAYQAARAIQERTDREEPIRWARVAARAQREAEAARDAYERRVGQLAAATDLDWPAIEAQARYEAAAAAGAATPPPNYVEAPSDAPHGTRYELNYALSEDHPLWSALEVVNHTHDARNNRDCVLHDCPGEWPVRIVNIAHAAGEAIAALPDRQASEAIEAILDAAREAAAAEGGA